MDVYKTPKISLFISLRELQRPRSRGSKKETTAWGIKARRQNNLRKKMKNSIAWISVSRKKLSIE